jgi:hypothetical protein
MASFRLKKATPFSACDRLLIQVCYLAHVIEKYHPHADYADACLVAMQEPTQAPIWTTDKRDFTRYRSRLSKPLVVVFPS